MSKSIKETPSKFQQLYYPRESLPQNVHFSSISEFETFLDKYMEWIKLNPDIKWPIDAAHSIITFISNDYLSYIDILSKWIFEYNPQSNIDHDHKKLQTVIQSMATKNFNDLIYRSGALLNLLRSNDPETLYIICNSISYIGSSIGDDDLLPIDLLVDAIIKISEEFELNSTPFDIIFNIIESYYPKDFDFTIINPLVNPNRIMKVEFIHSLFKLALNDDMSSKNWEGFNKIIRFLCLNSFQNLTRDQIISLKDQYLSLLPIIFKNNYLIGGIQVIYESDQIKTSTTRAKWSNLDITDQYDHSEDRPEFLYYYKIYFGKDFIEQLVWEKYFKQWMKESKPRSILSALGVINSLGFQSNLIKRKEDYLLRVFIKFFGIKEKGLENEMHLVVATYIMKIVDSSSNDQVVSNLMDLLLSYKSITGDSIFCKQTRSLYQLFKILCKYKPHLLELKFDKVFKLLTVKSEQYCRKEYLNQIIFYLGGEKFCRLPLANEYFKYLKSMFFQSSNQSSSTTNSSVYILPSIIHYLKAKFPLEFSEKIQKYINVVSKCRGDDSWFPYLLEIYKLLPVQHCQKKTFLSHILNFTKPTNFRKLFNAYFEYGPGNPDELFNMVQYTFRPEFIRCACYEHSDKVPRWLSSLQIPYFKDLYFEIKNLVDINTILEDFILSNHLFYQDLAIKFFLSIINLSDVYQRILKNVNNPFPSVNVHYAIFIENESLSRSIIMDDYQFSLCNELFLQKSLVPSHQSTSHSSDIFVNKILPCLKFTNQPKDIVISYFKLTYNDINKRQILKSILLNQDLKIHCEFLFDEKLTEYKYHYDMIQNEDFSSATVSIQNLVIQHILNFIFVPEDSKFFLNYAKTSKAFLLETQKLYSRIPLDIKPSFKYVSMEKFSLAAKGLYHLNYQNLKCFHPKDVMKVFYNLSSLCISYPMIYQTTQMENLTTLDIDFNIRLFITKETPVQFPLFVESIANLISMNKSLTHIKFKPGFFYKESKTIIQTIIDYCQDSLSSLKISYNNVNTYRESIFPIHNIINSSFINNPSFKERLKLKNYYNNQYYLDELLEDPLLEYANIDIPLDHTSINFLEINKLKVRKLNLFMMNSGFYNSTSNLFQNLNCHKLELYKSLHYYHSNTTFTGFNVILLLKLSTSISKLSLYNTHLHKFDKEMVAKELVHFKSIKIYDRVGDRYELQASITN